MARIVHGNHPFNVSKDRPMRIGREQVGYFTYPDIEFLERSDLNTLFISTDKLTLGYYELSPGAQFDPQKVNLTFESSAGSVMIAKDSVSTGYSEAQATKILSQDEITAIIDLQEGSAEATAWGCDLTHEYVTINADYRS